MFKWVFLTKTAKSQLWVWGRPFWSICVFHQTAAFKKNHFSAMEALR
jgi:hypothetical protein